jgi:hypothetical protein
MNKTKRFLPFAQVGFLLAALLFASSAVWAAEVTEIKEKAMDLRKWGSLYASGQPINPRIRWLARRKAVVWTIADLTRPLLKNSGRARIEGKKLIISYKTEAVKVRRGEPVAGGIVPMELEFTIKDLPSRKFEIVIQED